MDPTWPRVRAVDWGYSNPGWCGWFCSMPNGRAYLEKELLFRKTLASEVAKEIKAQSKGMKIRYTVGDTQMWATEGSGKGETIAETFSRFGVPMIHASKSREIGWQRLRHWLRPLEDGLPAMVFSPACRYAVRTIPSLVCDPNAPEDVDTNGEDHAGDGTRYYVMSRPSPARIPAPVYTADQWGAVLSSAAPRPAVLGAECVRTYP